MRRHGAFWVRGETIDTGYCFTMTAQLWVTAVVAVLGFASTLVGISLTSRNSIKLALQLRDVERRDARQDKLEACCREFLSAARVLRLPNDSARPEDQSSMLSELRRAGAGIELYSPDLAAGSVSSVLEAIERLVRLRGDGTWSASIIETEEVCDRALEQLRTAMATALGQGNE